MKLLTKALFQPCKNYDTSIIAWQNNNGDLFVVLDAWEAEYGSNRKVRQVAGYIEHSSSDRKTTRNEIIMNKYIKYSFVAVVILVVGFGVYYGMNNYNATCCRRRRPKYIPVRCILKLFGTNLKLPDMCEFGKSD
jgi:hypothetical protein